RQLDKIPRPQPARTGQAVAVRHRRSQSRHRRSGTAAMNATQFLESAVSVSLQAAIVVGAATLTRRVGRLSARDECRLWHWTHTILLGLVLIAATFPHLRLLAPAAL